MKSITIVFKLSNGIFQRSATLSPTKAYYFICGLMGGIPCLDNKKSIERWLIEIENKQKTAMDFRVYVNSSYTSAYFL